MTQLAIEEIAGQDRSRVVWVQAGAHGDEADGVLALDLFAAAARTGPPPVTLRVVRPANAEAYREGTRCASADGLDLNRCCPGDPAGSPTQRLAAELWSAARECDAVVDIHSSSPSLVGYPHIIVQAGDQHQHVIARAAARASEIPLVWCSTGGWLAGSLLHTATSAGLPAWLVDIGASRPGDPVPPLAPGLTKVLETLRRRPKELPPLAGGQLEVPDPQWLVAPAIGAVLTCLAAGTTVRPDSEVFVVQGRDGRRTAVTWPGPDPGIVVTVRTGRSVSAGTPVASVAALAGPVAPRPAAARRAAGGQAEG